MNSDTQQKLYIIFCCALSACLPIAVGGATALAIVRDGVAVQSAFQFYGQLASVVSVVLGGLGVTHLVMSGRQKEQQPMAPGAVVVPAAAVVMPAAPATPAAPSAPASAPAGADTLAELAHEPAAAR